MNTIEWTPQLRFIVALALGFLVGLERESSKSKAKKVILGGIRTYPIISMLGFGCAWLFQLGVTFILPVGLISVTALSVISYYTKVQSEKFGATSEITALLTFIVGALALLVDIWAAMALGIINTVLLSEKANLEDFVDNTDRAEFLAVIKFLLVTVIILPILPDQNFTKYELNPSNVWKVVIIVSTIGFIGYFLAKRFGNKFGLWLSGLLGGIVSSTAVTVAYGRMAQKKVSLAGSALRGVIVASSMMFARILVLIAIINPILVNSSWWKYILLLAIGFGLSLYHNQAVHVSEKSEKELQNLQNPFEIKPAVFFAVLFLLLSVVSKLVIEYFGKQGLLTLATVVGLTDITPFILSIIQPKNLDLNLVTSAIFLAMMSNTIMKGIYFGYLVPSLRKETALRFGILAATHIPFIILSII